MHRYLFYLFHPFPPPLTNLLQGLDQFHSFAPAQTPATGLVIIFKDKIIEVSGVPPEIAGQRLDQHFLSQSQTARIEAVIGAANKMVHQLPKLCRVKILGAFDTGRLLQDLAVSFVAEIQLALDNVDQGQFLVVHQQNASGNHAPVKENSADLSYANIARRLCRSDNKFR